MHKKTSSSRYVNFGRSTNKNSSTGVTGVSRSHDGRYRAYITVNNLQVYIGCFDTLDAAKDARKSAEQRTKSKRSTKKAARRRP